MAKDEKLTQDARNDAMLAVARLRYELADFTGALDAYNLVKLPSLDPGRAALYLEEAWTRYQLGQGPMQCRVDAVTVDRRRDQAPFAVRGRGFSGDPPRNTARCAS